MIQPGQIYRHKKGNRYRILAVDSDWVVYDKAESDRRLDGRFPAFLVRHTETLEVYSVFDHGYFPSMDGYQTQITVVPFSSPTLDGQMPWLRPYNNFIEPGRFVLEEDSHAVG